jgi:hypothetical protein
MTVGSKGIKTGPDLKSDRANCYNGLVRTRRLTMAKSTPERAYELGSEYEKTYGG